MLLRFHEKILNIINFQDKELTKKNHFLILFFYNTPVQCPKVRSNQYKPIF